MHEGSAKSFWERVEKVALTGCWVWRGHITANRYGLWSFWENGKTKTVYAHRVAYELVVGPIADGMVLDHLCLHRACVNPAHLDPVTQAENVRRGHSGKEGAAFQRSKTHCPSGHPYSGENLRFRKDGSRACRACQRQRVAERRVQRQAEEQQPAPRPRKEFCKNGHELTQENVYVIPSTGSRSCKECKRADVRAYRERKKAEQPPKPPRTHCKNGHELSPENTYLRESNGQRVCRKCHAARTLADYHRKKKAAESAS